MLVPESLWWTTSYFLFSFALFIDFPILVNSGLLEATNIEKLLAHTPCSPQLQSRRNALQAVFESMMSMVQWIRGQGCPRDEFFRHSLWQHRDTSRVGAGVLSLFGACSRPNVTKLLAISRADV